MKEDKLLDFRKSRMTFISHNTYKEEKLVDLRKSRMTFTSNSRASNNFNSKNWKLLNDILKEQNNDLVTDFLRKHIELNEQQLNITRTKNSENLVFPIEMIYDNCKDTRIITILI